MSKYYVMQNDDLKDTDDYRRLLNDVKTTVEGLLSVSTANVWNLPGGLKRLSASLELILYHKRKYTNDLSSASSLDYNHFVKSLHWLNPSLMPSAEKIRKRMSEEGIKEGLAWIRQSLLGHTLSAQIRALVSDRPNMLQFYLENAFICQPDYLEALCLCLEAVEQNCTAHLTNINPHLLIGYRQREQMVGKRSSLRDSSTAIPSKELPVQTQEPLINKLASAVTLRRQESGTSPRTNYFKADEPVPRTLSTSSMALDAILNSDHEDNNNGVIISGLPNKGKQPVKTHRQGHKRSKSDIISMKGLYVDRSAEVEVTAPNNTNIRTSGGAMRTSTLSASLPDAEGAMEQRIRNASFMDNDNAVVSEFSEGLFPQPRQGESLKSFLSSQDFDTCAELDRENAHFGISEALIAAIEVMKWNQVLRPAPAVLATNGSDTDSDEEIMRLKQKIKDRRRQKLRKTSAFSGNSSGNAKSSSRDSGTTPRSSSYGSSSLRDSDSLFSEESSSDDLQPQSDTESLLTLKDGLTISDRLSMENGNLVLSAEQVALSLLSQFNEYHLPKADQLDWLVSEQDAPQALLPLPNSFPISPDDMTEGRKGTRIRGNADWAPPRQQIVFNIHTAPNRKVLIAKQNYRCAGCGMKADDSLIKRFRYCEYLGKYFCQCCHQNTLSFVPSRILRRWDFTKYYVSNFARELLERLVDEPLFNIMDINSSLIRKVKAIERACVLRVQLRYARPFLASCRLGNEQYEKLLKIPAYYMDEVHVYSLNDLIKIKNGEFEKQLSTVVKEAINHITACQLCSAKGFICELCNKDRDIIFPFQLAEVIKCNVCQCCYHRTCFEKSKRVCPKCLRLERRKQQRVTVGLSGPEDV